MHLKYMIQYKCSYKRRKIRKIRHIENKIFEIFYIRYILCHANIRPSTLKDIVNVYQKIILLQKQQDIAEIKFSLSKNIQIYF